jgi:hypothetical protein
MKKKYSASELEFFEKMEKYSFTELNELDDYILERMSFHIKMILNERASDKLELAKKLKLTEEKPVYRNTMQYYKDISEEYEKNYHLIGPRSWFYQQITMELWNDYNDKFEEYISTNYLKVEDNLRPPFVDYKRKPL